MSSDGGCKDTRSPPSSHKGLQLGLSATGWKGPHGPKPGESANRTKDLAGNSWTKALWWSRRRSFGKARTYGKELQDSLAAGLTRENALKLKVEELQRRVPLAPPPAPTVEEEKSQLLPGTGRQAQGRGYIVTKILEAFENRRRPIPDGVCHKEIREDGTHVLTCLAYFKKRGTITKAMARLESTKIFEITEASAPKLRFDSGRSSRNNESSKGSGGCVSIR